MSRKWKFPPQIALHSGEKGVVDGIKRLKFSEIMTELAVELAFNHLDNSFGNKFTNERNDVAAIRELFEDVLARENGIWPEMVANLQNTIIKDLGDVPADEAGNLPALFSHWWKKNKTRRNVVVIGAGVSFDSYNCIPLGDQVKGFLSEKFIEGKNGLSKIDFLRRKYDRENNNLTELSGGLQDFENFLYLLQSFFVNGDDLRTELNDLIGYRHSPSLFYEIIAHLLKHQFIDVVINFNFEEMLDQAIDQEIGKDNYHFVLSDGHSVSVEDLISDSRIKRPVYIKPHGTYSHKSSLRFTKQHYLDMPEDISDMLSVILEGNRNATGGESKKNMDSDDKPSEAGAAPGDNKEFVDRVNLICVGFDMASIEFNRILNTKLPANSKIYHFLGPSPYTKVRLNDKDATDRPPLLELLTARLSGFIGRLDGNSRQDKIDKFEKDVYRPLWVLDDQSMPVVNKVTSPLAEIFSTLWRITHGLFDNRFSPRSIARHELVSYLFYDALEHIPGKILQESDPNGALFKKEREIYAHIERLSKQKQRLALRANEQSSDYFKDRLLVEIAIALIRNNGVVDIAHALKGRIGKMFALYQNSSGDLKEYDRLTIYDFFASFQGDSAEYVYRRNIFYLDSVGRGLDREKLRGWSNIGHIIERVAENFAFADREALDELVAKLRECVAEEDSPREKTQETKGQSPIKSESYNVFAASVVLLLLANHRLSENFKSRFLRVYNRHVYNGLVAESDTPRTVIEEIIRVCSKSNSSNFFHIGNDLNGTKQKIWESYRSQDLIDTNLSLLYHYMKTFRDFKWHRLLTLVEGGEVIRDIFESYRAEKRSMSDVKDLFSGREIFLLLSDEAVSNYHRAHSVAFCKDLADIKKQIKKSDRKQGQYQLSGPEYDLLLAYHRDFLFGPYKNVVQDNFHIFLMPVQEHNNHTTMFLESQKSNNMSPAGFKVDSFVVRDAYHLYRKGYSNSINPIRLNLTEFSELEEERKVQQERLKRDIDKHTLFFFMNLCRAVAYEQRLNSVNYKKAIGRDLKLFEWMSWEPERFIKQKERFFRNL